MPTVSHSNIPVVILITMTAAGGVDDNRGDINIHKASAKLPTVYIFREINSLVLILAYIIQLLLLYELDNASPSITYDDRKKSY